MGNLIPEEQEMPFGKLKVKARCKAGRGSVNAEAVVDAMQHTWTELRAAIDALDDGEKDQLREHFNNLIEDQGELGDILFGDADDFKSAVQFMESDLQQQYTDELIAQEVIDKAELEAEYN